MVVQSHHFEINVLCGLNGKHVDNADFYLKLFRRERIIRHQNAKRKKWSREAERIRQRVRDDPVKHQGYLRKERERNKKRKEEGKLKCISDLSNREQKEVRKSWRKRQQKHKTFVFLIFPT